MRWTSTPNAPRWTRCCAARARSCGADLRAARLAGADLRGALLIGTDLRDTDLRDTDLIGADLRAAHLCGADLTGALFLTRGQLQSAVGDASTRYVKSKIPADAAPLLDQFVAEGKELSKQNPAGSSWIEKIDCSKFASQIHIK